MRIARHALELVTPSESDYHPANRIPKVVSASAGLGFGAQRGGRIVVNRYAGVRGLDGAVPTLERNVDVCLYRGLKLSTAAGFAVLETSDRVPMFGNVFAASLLVENISAAAQVSVTIQGSYNGRVFKDLLTITSVGIGQTAQFIEQVAYAYLRALVGLSGTDQFALLSLYLCFARK